MRDNATYPNLPDHYATESVVLNNKEWTPLSRPRLWMRVQRPTGAADICSWWFAGESQGQASTPGWVLGMTCDRKPGCDSEELILWCIRTTWEPLKYNRSQAHFQESDLIGLLYTKIRKYKVIHLDSTQIQIVFVMFSVSTLHTFKHQS